MQSNALHMTDWTHLLYTSAQLISYVQMLLWCCFPVQYLSRSCESKVVVNSTHSTSNPPWLRYVFQSFFSIVGQRNLLKTICAIDRLKLWKHCFHFVSFPVVVWSQWVACLALHKNDACALLHCIFKLHIETVFYFW